MSQKYYDVFISHATEDKQAVAEPLANELLRLRVSVWYDLHQLRIGNSLSRAIDFGLSHSRFGALVVSPHFFAKEWPQRELAGLQALNASLLPIWHEITKEEVGIHSPMLAGLFALKTSELPIPDIAQHIANSVRETGRQSEEGSLATQLRDVVLYGSEYDEIGHALDQWQGDKSIGQSVLQARYCARQIIKEIDSIDPLLKDRRENVIYSFLEPACQTVLAISVTNQEPSTIESSSPWANLREAIEQTNMASADLMNHYGPGFQPTLAEEMGIDIPGTSSGYRFNWKVERMYSCLLNVEAKLRAIQP